MTYNEKTTKVRFYANMRWPGLLIDFNKLATEIGAEISTVDFEFYRRVSMNLGERFFEFNAGIVINYMFLLGSSCFQDKNICLRNSNITKPEDLDEVVSIARAWLVDGKWVELG